MYFGCSSAVMIPLSLSLGESLSLSLSLSRDDDKMEVNAKYINSSVLMY